MKQTLISIPCMAGMVAMLLMCQKADSAKKDSPESSKQSATVAPAPDSGSVVAGKKDLRQVVYYLHTAHRCYSCNLIESLTQKALESGFKSELAAGDLEFRSVNVEEAGNEHLVKHYQLYTKSVIVSSLSGGAETGWKNLDKVWTLLRDQEKFIEYIQAEVRAALKG